MPKASTGSATDGFRTLPDPLELSPAGWGVGGPPGAKARAGRRPGGLGGVPPPPGVAPGGGDNPPGGEGGGEPPGGGNPRGGVADPRAGDPRDVRDRGQRGRPAVAGQ